jgi:hypothetical protein
MPQPKPGDPGSAGLSESWVRWWHHLAREKLDPWLDHRWRGYLLEGCVELAVCLGTRGFRCFDMRVEDVCRVSGRQ